MLFSSCTQFCKDANNILQELEDCELEVQAALPEKGLRNKKMMADESAQDEVISDAIAAHRIQVHNVILDVIIESMNCRFLASGTLYADYFACLDPRNFSDLRDWGLQLSALG
jgi:hypothetical protein